MARYKLPPGPGRPKGSENKTTTAMKAALKGTCTDKEAAKALWGLAKGGNPAAINQYYNRRWGAVPVLGFGEGELGFQLTVFHKDGNGNGNGDAAPGAKPPVARRRKKQGDAGRSGKKVG